MGSEAKGNKGDGKARAQGGGSGGAAASKGITPRAQDYAQWYGDVIEKGELAEHAPVRGCMVIRPYGFAVWEGIRDALDRMIKDTGHVNAYFPLFIPKSFLSKEAEHVEGFAKECAIVTHSRLVQAKDGKGLVPDPDSRLEEELVVRPTSETIIYDCIRGWIQSWRDLPLLLNQWANVVRWEMRTRLFLRTLEFLWQEGHTVHATHEEGIAEAEKMLGVYRTLLEEHMAIPVVPGRKSDSERFAGAVTTFSVEAMMQDGKALQAGTSHDLGQNFSKPFDLRYLDKDGQQKHPWTTSWGVSTRLIGGLIMTHSDDKGLVLPPRLAPIHVVIVPIWKSDQDRARIDEYVRSAAASLGDARAFGAPIRVRVDAREQMNPGAKFYEWERKGVPLRVEVGPRDVDKGEMVVCRRDTGEKAPVSKDAFAARVPALLEDVQRSLFERAKKFRDEHTFVRADYAGLREVVDGEKGWVRGFWCGDAACEAKMKDETKATIRCLPFDGETAEKPCVACGTVKPGNRTAIFARNY